MNIWVWITIVVAIGFAVPLIIAFRQRTRNYPVQPRQIIIHGAIDNGLDLKMVYFSNSKRRFSERVVTPISIDDTGHLLRALDHKRKHTRSFRLSGMKSLKPIPRATIPLMVAVPPKEEKKEEKTQPEIAASARAE